MSLVVQRNGVTGMYRIAGTSNSFPGVVQNNARFLVEYDEAGFQEEYKTFQEANSALDAYLDRVARQDDINNSWRTVEGVEYDSK